MKLPVKLFSCTFDVNHMDQSPTKVLEQVCRGIDGALAQGGDIIIFPEYLWAGMASYYVDEHAKYSRTAPVIWNELIPQLVDEYHHSDTVICLGSAPMLYDNKLTNCSPLITSQGLLIQQKLFLTPWEHHLGFKEHDTIHIFQLNGMKIAVLICFDIELPDISMMLRNYDVDIVLTPAATETYHGSYRVQRGAAARAIETGAAVVVSQLTGEIGDKVEVVSENVGCTGLFMPLQEPLDVNQAGQMSPIQQHGTAWYGYDLNLQHLRQARESGEEANPALVTGKPSIHVEEHNFNQ